MASPAARYGRYEVRATLGSGAMGIVYSAWDPDLQRPVAIKVIKNALNDDALARFQREAQTLAQLSHPNIVAVHDIGATDGCPFIVMELIEGEPLSSEIERRADRSLTEKIDLAAQVCDALVFAHRLGVLHRDVKPANILLTSRGTAKLADFGLARLQSSSLTASAQVVGTPAYLPPEAFAGERIDERADVYGLAACLYEWVSGARPHDADHLATLMARVMNSDSPDVRRRWPGCPPSLAMCLKRGLARDRAERFKSAEEFAVALRGTRVEPESADRLTSTVLLTSPNIWKRRVQAAIAGGLAVIASGVAIGTCRPRSTTSVNQAELTRTLPTVSPETKLSSTAAPQSAGPPKAIPAANAASRVPSARRLEVTPSEPAGAKDTNLAEVDEPPALSVPIGSKVLVRVLTTLRTDRSRPGQTFDAELAEPLTWNGHQVAQLAAPVRGVVDAVFQGDGGRPSSMQLSLVTITVGDHAERVRTARYEIVAPAPQRSQRPFIVVIGAVSGAVVGGAIGGQAGAAAGAALGASVIDGPSVVGDSYVLGNRLTFKLAEPLRLQPGTD